MTWEKMLVEQRWPFEDPEKIQLLSLATPNGVKVSVALEELGLAYEPHLVHIGQGDQFTPEYVSLSPNSKIPAIVDPQGASGEPLILIESGAILIYLAEKSGRLMPTERVARQECLQWLFFQVAHVGPMFGQLGHFFKYAKETCTHPYPVERYVKEVNRLLGVLEKQLEGREYLMADYSIADIATFPWVGKTLEFYGAQQAVGYESFPNVVSWCDRCEARPAAIAGRKVCTVS